MAVRTYYPRCGVILDVLVEDFATGTTGGTYTLEVVPREVTVTRNDHRTADTCRVELDFKDFPFDPRTVRSARVRVIIWDGDPAAPEQIRGSVQPAFIGFLDAPETRLGDGGETVVIECRDFTSVFLDHRWTEAIDVTRPLANLLEAFAAQVPGAEGTTFGYSEGVGNLVLAGALGRTRWTPAADDDAWTVLVNLLGRVGLIPVFEGDLLLVLTAGDFGVNREAFLRTNELTPTRATFLYGENLSRLEYRRNLVDVRALQVQVTAWDEASRTARSVTHPAAPVVTKRRITAEGKVTSTAAPIVPYFVSGAYTDAELAALAQRVYDEAIRAELQGTLETRDLVDLEHHQPLPVLGNGARIKVELGTALLSNIAGLSDGEAVRSLVASGMQTAIATALVAAFRKAGRLAVEFYVRRAVHHWSAEDGYRVELDFVNYLGGPT